MTLWYELKTIDGRVLSRTHGAFGHWQWILDNVMPDAECLECEVNVEEAEEADYVTVRGKRYARVIAFPVLMGDRFPGFDAE